MFEFDLHILSSSLLTVLSMRNETGCLAKTAAIAHGNLMAGAPAASRGSSNRLDTNSDHVHNVVNNITMWSARNHFERCLDSRPADQLLGCTECSRWCCSNLMGIGDANCVLSCDTCYDCKFWREDDSASSCPKQPQVARRRSLQTLAIINGMLMARRRRLQSDWKKDCKVWPSPTACSW